MATESTESPDARPPTLRWGSFCVQGQHLRADPGTREDLAQVLGLRGAHHPQPGRVVSAVEDPLVVQAHLPARWSSLPVRSGLARNTASGTRGSAAAGTR